MTTQQSTDAMIIPKVSLNDTKDFIEVLKILDSIKKNEIPYANWTNYDSYPDISFKIAHDGQHLFLQFIVEEDEIRAVTKGNNSRVYEDSCVELFISFDDTGYYYNLEQSCIGEVLLGYRKVMDKYIRADKTTLDNIKRQSTLGNQNFDLKKGRFEWSLTSIIPVGTFWMNDLQTFDGVKAKANFYKCGDKLTKPHFMSWNPVETEKRSFHQVDFFKEIHFQ